MSHDIKVPVLPESVADAVVAKWYKKPGDTITRDEKLVDLETDKVMLEVPAVADGVLAEIIKNEGDVVKAEEILGRISAGEGKVAASAPASAPAPASKSAVAEQPNAAASTVEKPSSGAEAIIAELSPSLRRMITDKNIDVTKIKGTGKGGRIVKEDVEKFLQAPTSAAESVVAGDRTEKRVPMSRLRAKIAERLVAAQHNAAMLTTFNEINLQKIIDLRTHYKDQFEKTHGVKLGFMSFFVKAVIEALKRFPSVNASIDGTDVIYHGYFDIGIAVSTPRGLVVPVLRDADQLNMAGIEKGIYDYAVRARDGKLELEEITGGTFTITNGGVFGSMLSTPILNPPQSAILGMHKITERAVVEEGKIVIRPMMYVALSYDHRIIDGRESVGFVVAIKELLEEPSLLLLDI
ncbi:MAG: 2-oxoglutarate dehydrogenase complex dihydrolipoyllysine-residue succinyltransferase [Gammaproteobacteria bacterium]|nr:2-oxoglutarate dehydrogenase complex dihydrolipoyllysine-residue succinyltransferase [Gammaproteobacteria bacterium]